MYKFIHILVIIGNRLVKVLMEKLLMITWGFLSPSPVTEKLWLLMIIKIMGMIDTLGM